MPDLINEVFLAIEVLVNTWLKFIAVQPNYKLCSLEYKNYSTAIATSSIISMISIFPPASLKFLKQSGQEVTR